MIYTDSYLEHYGVKGMHWGIRNDPEPSGNGRRFGLSRQSVKTGFGNARQSIKTGFGKITGGNLKTKTSTSQNNKPRKLSNKQKAAIAIAGVAVGVAVTGIVLNRVGARRAREDAIQVGKHALFKSKAADIANSVARNTPGINHYKFELNGSHALHPHDFEIGWKSGHKPTTAVNIIDRYVNAAANAQRLEGMYRDSYFKNKKLQSTGKRIALGSTVVGGMIGTGLLANEVRSNRTSQAKRNPSRR